MRIHTPPLETLQGWLASTQRAATWRWSPPPTVKCPLEALPPSWAARAGMSMMLVSALLLWCVELSRVLQLTASLVVPPGVSLYRLCKPWWEEMWAAFLLHGPLLWPSFLSLCLSVSSLDVSHVPVLLFFLPSFPNYYRADGERTARAKWNGHRLLAEPLWPSPQQPHPQPLWYTSHASQPYTYPTATPRKPQLPSLEDTPSTWLGQRAVDPGNVRPTFNLRPSLCLRVCSIRHWDVEMEG